MTDPFFLDIKSCSFAGLMAGPVRYTVPEYQGNYAWGRQQWEDLAADIQDLSQEKSHYMGYVVLERKEKDQYEIIDGQQRFVTLTLLIVSLMAKLASFIAQGVDVLKNRERLTEIENRYIGAKNLVTLTIESKLTLNRNNRAYFKGICSDLRPAKVRANTRTNALLCDAFEFFARHTHAEKGEDIALFLETFTSSLIFTRIVVQDSLNAYKVFETLNARAVGLSVPDLIKNSLFSVIAEEESVTDSELDEMDERWTRVVDQLGEQDFTTYVRLLYNCQHPFTAKKNLFREIRLQYKQAQEAVQYLRDLETNAALYASLSTPYDQWWNTSDGRYTAIKAYLEGLSLFAVQQPLVVFLAAYPLFSSDEFVLLAKYLYILAIRYNVICNKFPHELERTYNTIALAIRDGKLKRASHVKNSAEFKRLYPDDDTFKHAFAFHRMPSRASSRDIRFLLAEIERFNGRSVDYEQTVLEHVCPYNPDQGWVSSFGEGIRDITDRLGNMVLLDHDTLQRMDFPAKKEAYRASGKRLAQEVASYDRWTLASVNKYQMWLAQEAVKTWRIDWARG